jgi:WD40 repeat protein
MCFMPDGKLIMTAWSDGKVRAFLPQSGRLAYVIHDAHKNGVTAIGACGSCTRLVTGGYEGEVRVWRLGPQSQTMEANLKEHRSRVWSIQVTKDDQKAFTSSADGSCILWDLISKTRSICLFESTQFKSIMYHPDEAQVLTTGSDRKITYWDTFDGQAIRILEGSTEGELATLGMSKSGSHFVSGSQDTLVKLWNYDTGLTTHIGAAHSLAVNCVAISPDQQSIVSVGQDGAIFIWGTPDEAYAAMTDESLLEG